MTLTLLILAFTFSAYADCERVPEFLDIACDEQQLRFDFYRRAVNSYCKDHHSTTQKICRQQHLILQDEFLNKYSEDLILDEDEVKINIIKQCLYDSYEDEYEMYNFPDGMKCIRKKLGEKGYE